MSDSHASCSLCCLLAIGLILPLSASPAIAATYWWDTTTTGTWASTANWWTTAVGTTTGGPPGAFNDALFNGTGVNGAAIVQIGTGTSVLGMTFANTGTTLLESTGSAANALTIGTDGITVNAGAGAVTLGNPSNPLSIILGGSQTWTNNSSGLLTVSSSVSDNSNDFGINNVLTVAGSGNTTILATTPYSSEYKLTKNGAGVLTLTGTAGDFFTTTVNGGTVDLNGNSATLYTLTLVNGAIVNSSTAAATLTATSYAVQSGSVAVGLAGASTGLAKTTSGTVTLSASNGYGGGTTLNGGLLQVANNTALGSGDLSLNAGTLSSSSTAAYTLFNPLTLSGSVTLGSAANNGALNFSYGGQVSLGWAQPVFLDVSASNAST